MSVFSQLQLWGGGKGDLHVIGERTFQFYVSISKAKLGYSLLLTKDFLFLQRPAGTSVNVSCIKLT